MNDVAEAFSQLGTLLVKPAFDSAYKKEGLRFFAMDFFILTFNADFSKREIILLLNDAHESISQILNI